MSLLHLADETLLHIAQLLPPKLRYGDPNAVLQLARTCKRVQRVCDSIIWSKYVLVIRSSEEYRGKYVYAPKDRYKCTEEEWNALWAKRIAHLLSKAAVVRDLTIEDTPFPKEHYHRKSSGTPDGLPFAQDLMEAAMAAVSACKAVQTFRVVSASDELAQWPTQLWPLIMEGFPFLDSLVIKADFIDVPLPEGSSPKPLEYLEVRWVAGLVDGFLALEMILPEVLKIDFSTKDVRKPTDNRWAPAPDSQLARHIQYLDVHMHDFSLPGPVFDLSALQHASVCISICFTHREYKFQIPPSWRRLKPHIASVVDGGLEGYDVVRNGDVYIVRPSLVECPDYTPRWKDHLCSEADDIKEQEEMNAYYAERRFG